MSRPLRPPLVTPADYHWWALGAGFGAIIAGVTAAVLVGLDGRLGITRGLIALFGL